MKNRYLTEVIDTDALKDKKIAFISGPRQVRKTTLGKQLLKDSNSYFSWDETHSRKVWTKSPEKLLESKALVNKKSGWDKRKEVKVFKSGK